MLLLIYVCSSKHEELAIAQNIAPFPAAAAAAAAAVVAAPFLSAQNEQLA